MCDGRLLKNSLKVASGHGLTEIEVPSVNREQSKIILSIESNLRP